MTLMLGVDVGQRRESSGLFAAELQRREDSGREMNHYVIRYLERIAIGTPYPGIIHRVGAVVHALADRTGTQPAFRVGRHDDLVTALGLAVQGEPTRPGIF